jgi:hypothetical protein
MVPGAWVAKHDPIEPLMIAELTDQLEAQTGAVEVDDRIEMIGRASDPKMSKHEASKLCAASGGSFDLLRVL